MVIALGLVSEVDEVCPRSKVQVPSLLVWKVLNYEILYLPTFQILTSFYQSFKVAIKRHFRFNFFKLLFGIGFNI